MSCVWGSVLLLYKQDGWILVLCWATMLPEVVIRRLRACAGGRPSLFPLTVVHQID